LLLVADDERTEEAVLRLARIGYERVAATLAGDMAAWQAAGMPVAKSALVPAASLAGGSRHVLDVRRGTEWEIGHLPGATHIPLAQLESRAKELDRSAEWVAICASGYRSSIAASVLQRAGFERAASAAGGMNEYLTAGLPVEVGATTGA
jgi:hydroxyacylglutathione hydrolase